VKKLGPLIILLLVLGGGFYVYTEVLGGSIGGPTKTPGVSAPDVEMPDADDVQRGVGKAGDGAVEGAKEGSDFLAGLDPVIWRTVVPAAIMLFALAWIWKDPKRRSLALVVLLIGVLAFVVSRT